MYRVSCSRSKWRWLVPRFIRSGGQRLQRRRLLPLCFSLTIRPNFWLFSCSAYRHPTYRSKGAGPWGANVAFGLKTKLMLKRCQCCKRCEIRFLVDPTCSLICKDKNKLLKYYHNVTLNIFNPLIWKITYLWHDSPYLWCVASMRAVVWWWSHRWS